MPARERTALFGYPIADDPLATRQSICLADFADRPISEAPALPREMLDAFFPPVTPSGRVFARVELHSTEEIVMRIAAGEFVHPTVASFPTHC